MTGELLRKLKHSGAGFLAQIIEMFIVTSSVTLSFTFVFLANYYIWCPNTLKGLFLYSLLIFIVTLAITLEAYVTYIKPRFRFLIKYGFEDIKKKKPRSKKLET